MNESFETIVKSLPPKQRRFVLEWVKDHDNRRAAIAAGYSQKTASAIACNLLSKPRIKQAIARLEKRVIKKTELDLEEVLRQLYYLATRSGGDFVDDNGRLLPIQDLPERAQQAIDGIEQEVTTLRDQAGNEVGEKVKTKLKLVSKASAVDMAMKHFGAYNEDLSNATVIQIDWDKMQGADDDPSNVLDIEADAKRIKDSK